MKLIHNKKSESGAVLLFTMVLFTIMILMMGAMATYTASEVASHRISVNKEKALNIAEAGVEMAIWKLNNQAGYSGESNTSFGGGTYDISVTTVDSSKKTITVTSYIPNNSNSTSSRTIKVNANIGTTTISFHYGAQVGAGGLQMSNNSRIVGSVFSGGNITGSGNATITNDVIVSGNGHNISGMDVNGNVLAYTCTNSVIDGNLTYVTGGTNNCSVNGTTSTQSDEIATQPLPISQDQIDTWKGEALAGGTTGNLTLSGSQTMSLGPKKITGDLSISNSAILTLTGPVYVTGNITISNSGKIKLASSYGSLGGVILSDGTINPSNSSMLEGSGQNSSYLLVLSTSASSSAITVSNSASGAIFYANNGGINVSNNFSAREVTGYRLIMNNNATITYESGLADTFFSSGPGGSWEFEPGTYLITK